MRDDPPTLPDTPPEAPRRVLPANRLIVLGGFGIYALALVLAARRWQLPDIGWRAAWFLTIALFAEFFAKWLFAVLFRDALSRQGHTVSLRAAFSAALIGSAVARLVPAGGALTPTAMAWTVRREDDESAGAALRTTITSYGGLLLLTGIALGWGVSTGRHPVLFAGAVLAGVVLAAAGVFVLIGSRWLEDVVARLPERLRRHFGPTSHGGYVTVRETALILARIVTEATVLWSALRAFEINLTPSQTMVAFGISTVVGGIPATPGGVGVVEGGLVGVLAGFRFAVGNVVAPVLVYRVIDYWIAAGAGVLVAAYLTRRQDRAPRPA